MAKQTLVLVHGAWHRAASFDPIVPLLKQHGYPMASVELPSSGATLGAATHLAEDRAAIRAVVERIEGDVVVVAHSYGGIATTHALDGLDDKVKALVYICAFLPEVGTSLVDNLEQLGTWLKPEGDILHVIDPEKTFYHDFPPELKEKYLTDYQRQSAPSFGEKVTYAAWKDIPATYIVSTRDIVLAASDQERMVATALANPGKAGKLKVKRLETGHFPMVHMPEEVVAIIVQAASTA